MADRTYKQQFDEALACKTQEEADEWLAREIERSVAQYGQTPEHAEKVIKSNLGYMAGYCDEAAAVKVHELFKANHPVFGEPGYHTRMSPKEMFQAGVELAKQK